MLKILIARRGRAVPRDVLMEALWPEEDPAKLREPPLGRARDACAACSIPEKAFPTEHFVSADKNAVRLELAHVAVDVEAFLADALGRARPPPRGSSRRGARAAGRGRGAYAGGFLEEDAYEDWAQPLRDEAQARLRSASRCALAADAAARGDHDAAGRYYLRVLEHDPYDENAHLGLVSTLLDAGRHGEARRFYRDYCARMEEIGVEPAPFPAAPPRPRASCRRPERNRARVVDGYLAGLPEERREAIAAVRAVILDNLPDGFEEGCSTG